MRTKIVWLISISWVAASCGMDGTYLDDPGNGKAELKPDDLLKCQVKVAGKILDMETEYLPKVIACENAGADYEAMLANAIAARTYAYYIQYEERKTGQLFDDIRDQTFNCKNPVTETIRAAIRATSGEVITYKGNLIASFYVLGAKSAGEGAKEPCMGVGSSGSEKYVTYNEGEYGSQVTRSKIGGSVEANRGCLSQLSAECLSLKGYDHLNILKYFYGEDISLDGAKCQGGEQTKFPLPEVKGISLSCDNCDLSTHDCVHYRDTGYECAPRSLICNSFGGTTKRQCECDGWEYCTSRDEWSGVCGHDAPYGFFDCTIPEEQPENQVSTSCEGCNLSTHDCTYRIGESGDYECVEKSDACEIEGNEMLFRQCGCNGYQSCEWDYGFEGTASWSLDCKDSENMFECETQAIGPVSATCDGCDLAANDCLYENKQFSCKPKSDQCNSNGGTTAKQCNCDGWMYCLSSGAWSGNCGDAPQGFFECT